MTDHTPEPWSEATHGTLINGKLLIVLDPKGADWKRAQACLDACAGVPTEQLGDVRALIDAVEWQLRNQGGSNTLIRAFAPFRKD